MEAAPMTNWVKCTDSKGEPIYVNLALAITIKATKKGTRVAFLGDDEDYVDVKEPPEKLVRT
jgi:hypothetical protein